MLHCHSFSSSLLLEEIFREREEKVDTQVSSFRTCFQKLGHATVNHSVQFSERFLCSLVSQLGRNTERSGISPSSGPRKSRLLGTGFQIRPRWNALGPVSTVSSAVGTMSVPEGNPVQQKELMSFWELLDLS